MGWGGLPEGARGVGGEMQTYFIYKGVRGYHRLMSIAEYINHPERAEIERRVEIIEFFDEFWVGGDEEGVQGGAFDGLSVEEDTEGWRVEAGAAGSQEPGRPVVYSRKQAEKSAKKRAPGLQMGNYGYNLPEGGLR
jgi:hypothetical protein